MFALLTEKKNINHLFDLEYSRGEKAKRFWIRIKESTVIWFNFYHYLPVYLSMCMCIYSFIYLSIYVSVYLTIVTARLSAAIGIEVKVSNGLCRSNTYKEKETVLILIDEGVTLTKKNLSFSFRGSFGGVFKCVVVIVCLKWKSLGFFKLFFVVLGGSSLSF